uniref:Uncharacterized protein n=1 Tax=viral metagenome TaxID=1070528 RepID=A0A6M3IP96_9ZZZZ
MPYDVKKIGGQWCVINTDTGAVKGKHGQDKNKAMKQMRLLYMVKKG